MKTPSLESREDQKREERVAGFLEGLWGVSCHKLPTSYSLDYWIESQEKTIGVKLNVVPLRITSMTL
jgi:hypothetical protein